MADEIKQTFKPEDYGEGAAEWVPIGSIMPDPANVRIHDGKNLAAIKASLAKFGQRKPIVVGKADKIIQAGNGQYLAAKELGWPQIWVAWSPLMHSEAIAYAIADNRTADLSKFDDSALYQQLQALKGEGWEAKELGWDDKDWTALEKVINPRKALEEGGTNGEGGTGGESSASDNAKREAQARWQVQPGQLWLIPSRSANDARSTHRLLCGDSLRRDHLSVLLEIMPITTLITSPPYWTDQEYDEKVGIVGISDFMSNFAKVWARIPKRRIIIQTGHTTAALIGKRGATEKILLDSMWQSALREYEWYLRHRRLWIKAGKSTFSAGYGPKTDIIDEGWEVILTFHTPSNTDGTERVAADGDWVMNGVWTLPVQDDDKIMGHPCAYPIELVGRLIELYSKPGDIVVDPFSGAGTTIVAAEMLGRVGYGVELSPEYCALSLDRFKNLGMEPRLAGA